MQQKIANIICNLSTFSGFVKNYPIAFANFGIVFLILYWSKKSIKTNWLTFHFTNSLPSQKNIFNFFSNFKMWISKKSHMLLPWLHQHWQCHQGPKIWLQEKSILPLFNPKKTNYGFSNFHFFNNFQISFEQRCYFLCNIQQISNFCCCTYL